MDIGAHIRKSKSVIGSYGAIFLLFLSLFTSPVEWYIAQIGFELMNDIISVWVRDYARWGGGGGQTTV